MSAINSASASTAQAAAQLQTLATELLQSRHIQQLTSALNGVVYGRQAGIVAHAAAAGSHGSNGSDAAAMANRWYQQQQAFEEEQQQAGWQQQLQAWQEQQQQQAEGESGQFAATEQQQQQLQAWQADVIRSWVDDVSAGRSSATMAWMCLHGRGIDICIIASLPSCLALPVAWGYACWFVQAVGADRGQMDGNGPGLLFASCLLRQHSLMPVMTYTVPEVNGLEISSFRGVPTCASCKALRYTSVHCCFCTLRASVWATVTGVRQAAALCPGHQAA